MTSTDTAAALQLARKRLADLIDAGMRNGAFTPGRTDMGPTVEANNRLAYRRGLYMDLANIAALEARLALEMAEEGLASRPKPEALQAILGRVATINRGYRQPSIGELEREGWSKAAVHYLLDTGLLKVYAGLYVTEEGHEALALAREAQVLGTVGHEALECHSSPDQWFAVDRLGVDQ